MPEIHVVVGVAGAGKTRHAMNLIEQRLRDGVKWNEIGFASFSRAACSEAARRASVITGVDSDRLQKEGWFRTIHSSVFKCLGLDSKVILDHDTKAGREFVADACGAARGGDTGTLGARVEEALSHWDTIRAKLTRLRQCSLPVLPESVTSVTGVTGCHGLAAPSPEDTFTNEFTGSEAVAQGLLRLHRGKSLLKINKENVRCVENLGAAVDEITDSESLYVGNIQEKSVVTQRRGTPEFLAMSPGAPDDTDRFEHIIRQYEDAKRYSGMRDFTDILLEYAGFQVDSDLNFKSGYAAGIVPQDLQVFFVDEAQDNTMLLDCCAERLSGFAQELYFLGDGFQSIYAFSGSQKAIFEAREKDARSHGRRTLLNKSYRNPNCVIKWGEEVLNEDKAYEERNPYSDIHDGSVGMSEWNKFVEFLPRLALTDSMILARTWFALGKVKDRLDQLCIPWRSAQEKKSSQWEAPTKIAIVLTMQALRDGEKISEQDFRRLTENFPMKLDGLELFKRGEKSRWKRLACSGDNVKTLSELEEWGIGDGFVEFVQQEKWRRDVFLLLSIAIEKFGIETVRNPKIQLGSCHSVKGAQAENVFCLATSSEKASQSSVEEDICLRYVTITRAKKNFRVIVDMQDVARGRKLFLPSPKGYWIFGDVLPDEDCRKVDSIASPEDAEQTAGDMGSEVSSNDLRDCRNAGHSDMLPREVPRDGNQNEGREAVGDAETAAGENLEEWWSFPSDSKSR